MIRKNKNNTNKKSVIIKTEILIKLLALLALFCAAYTVKLLIGGGGNFVRVNALPAVASEIREAIAGAEEVFVGAGENGNEEGRSEGA
ncbi:MAG: hypothetical protein VB118_06815 [Oscillospiraceae bacterium]|nr:hypothetical protein [Oscillospiraceae bacterium]